MPDDIHPPSSQADELAALLQDAETVREVSSQLRAQIDHSAFQLHEAILLAEHDLSVVAVHLAAARAAHTVREAGWSLPSSGPERSPAPETTRSADSTPAAVSEPVVERKGDALENGLGEQTLSSHQQANADLVNLLTASLHAAGVVLPEGDAAAASDSPTLGETHGL